MIDATKLEAWRKLAEKATPGPWTIVRYDNEGGDINWQVIGTHDVIRDCSDLTDDCAKATSEFVAASREAVPALLQEVERLTKELSEALAATDGAILQTVQRERKRYRSALDEIRNKTILWRRNEEADLLRAIHTLASGALAGEEKKA